jgi:hypothetical protein
MKTFCDRTRLPGHSKADENLAIRRILDEDLSLAGYPLHPSLIESRCADCGCQSVHMRFVVDDHGARILCLECAS